MLTPEERAEGWEELFDGKTLNGWAPTGRAEGWTVDEEEKAILCTVRGGGYLYTLDEFDNFILKIDFKIDPGVNSGIFFRWSDLSDPVHTGLEMQILDTYGKEPPGKHDCGALYDMVPPKKSACKPAGEWNHVVITCKGPYITIDMNGERIIDVNIDDWDTPGMNPDGTKNKFKYAWKDLPKRGHIGLQDHGGKVWFRNIKIKRLS
ncbi:TPA: DUF1080 domain-containing protein [Candidatus Poribacteria bacterium]|nr:DUF1080 domain-containing protein [Candidatus Poribacteria bacterium]